MKDCEVNALGYKKICGNNVVSIFFDKNFNKMRVCFLSRLLYLKKLQNVQLFKKKYGLNDYLDYFE